MTTISANLLSEIWPLDALEAVSACPYCGCPDRALAYEGVQDWSFGCASGKWNYWDCGQCRALYLNPRPTATSIGRAYASYFTHVAGQRSSLLGRIKQRLRNEYWSYSWEANLTPRLGLPRWAGWPVRWLEPWITEQFGLRELAQLPKGLLIDVGCGNGDKLKLAQQLGWRALGIELDASAVKVALAQDVNVIQGGYEELAAYAGQADCVICSHVLEHVHNPSRLLRLLLDTLKPDGVLLLTVPNAASYLRAHYGPNWRGLEAPRHLAIPDVKWLTSWLSAAGFASSQRPSSDAITAIESERIKRRGMRTEPDHVKAAKSVLGLKDKPAMDQQDIVQIVCHRASA